VEVDVIALTEQHLRALEKPETTPPRLKNPRTQESFVLLRIDEYERLKADEYDDSPWTREELHALAWEIGDHSGRAQTSTTMPRRSRDPGRRVLVRFPYQSRLRGKKRPAEPHSDAP